MSDDICNAIDWVGCTTDSKDHAHDIRMKAHKELNKLRAENERLREALKPFSWQWNKYGKIFEDDGRLIQIAVSTGDLRFARAALEGVKEKRDREMSDMLELNHKGAVPKDIDGTADEITRLRADLAAVTAERDRLLNNNDKMLVQIEKFVVENNEWHSAANFPDKSPRALRLESANLWEKNKELREEIEKLRDALKPFSDAASTDDYIDDIEIAETDTARKITFGDLRRARVILEGAPK